MCEMCRRLGMRLEAREHDAMAAMGAGVSEVVNAGGKPKLSTDRIADRLLGYWDDPKDPGGWDQTTITYNVSDLSGAGRRLARAAFEEWGAVTGLTFKSRGRNDADIQFTDSDDGAYAYFYYDYNGFGDRYIASAFVNVSDQWLREYPSSYDSFNFQVFLHEIGHALGLSHPGDYNGDEITFARDAEFRNDSWQNSVMSYFSQDQASGTDADFAFAVTPMIADIAAVRRIYGDAPARDGDSVYGEGSNVGGMLGRALRFDAPVTATIMDTGGHDLVDLRGQSADLRIDLRQGRASDVAGLDGNMLIARGTIIEDARAGRGEDRLIGNIADNDLRGGGGDDVMRGSGGDDRLLGQDGWDHLRGEDGDDRLWGASGRDTLDGGKGADRLDGGGSNDRLLGGGGDDRLRGEGGRDTLKGGKGDDYLNGGDADDRLRGGGGDDEVRGGDAEDHLSGEDGHDYVSGGRGNDVVDGDTGDDRLFGQSGDDRLSGGHGRDRLDGGTGDDVLQGESGDDRLVGGRGHDELHGGRGDDVLIGEDGFDAFVFAGRFGHDRITDFSRDPREVIDLGRVDAITSWNDLRRHHLERDGDDAVIEVGENSIVIEGLRPQDLDASDFVF